MVNFREEKLNLCNLLTKEPSHGRVKGLFLLPASDSQIFFPIYRSVCEEVGERRNRLRGQRKSCLKEPALGP